MIRFLALCPKDMNQEQAESHLFSRAIPETNIKIKKLVPDDEGQPKPTDEKLGTFDVPIMDASGPWDRY